MSHVIINNLNTEEEFAYRDLDPREAQALIDLMMGGTRRLDWRVSEASADIVVPNALQGGEQR